MSDFRQALLGIFAALVSCSIVIGSLMLSLVESGWGVAQVPATQVPSQGYPSPVFLVDTPGPGEPTFTPSPSPQPSPTIGLPTPTPMCAYPTGWMMITVQLGDTLESLAQAYGTTPEALLSGNCLAVDLLLPGSSLYVPPLPKPPTATATLPPTQTLAPSSTATDHACSQPPPGWLAYTVRWGDTLASISLWSGASVAELKKANCLKTDQIYAGQRLWVPRMPPPPTPIPYRTPTQQPTIPPTATTPPTQVPPTAVPPTSVPPTPVPPTLVPPTTAPSDTLVPPTPVPPTPVPPTVAPTTAPPPPTEPPTVPPTEPPIPVTQAPADLVATPTPSPEAAVSPASTVLKTVRLDRPVSFGATYSIFVFPARSVIIHPDGVAMTAPASPIPYTATL